MVYIPEWYQKQQYHQITLPYLYQKYEASLHIPEWYQNDTTPVNQMYKLLSINLVLS